MELSPQKMTDEEILETLKYFIVGNFEIPSKVSEAINEVIVRMETSPKIVQCKDCKYKRRVSWSKDYYCTLWECIRSDDRYCADGVNIQS